VFGIASIRFQTDNKRFQTAIFLGLGDLFCNFALRGGAGTAPQKIEFQGQLGSNLPNFNHSNLHKAIVVYHSKKSQTKMQAKHESMPDLAP